VSETDGTPVGEAKIVVPPTAAPGSVIYVRALISHPMHTGLFRDSAGAPIAAWFIREVVVAYGDEEVARFEWTSGISRDPFVTFPLRVTRTAPLTMTWKDNAGGVFTETAQITVG
jgi:sulfur-oxidizing protein SoxZ